MKKYIFSILACAATLLACSCSQQQVEVSTFCPQSYLTRSSSTEDFQLKEKDIQAYIHYLSVNDLYRGNKVQSIKAIDRKGITVFYALDFENGWQLISADKRGPVLLAKSPEGHYETEPPLDAIQAWYDAIADEIIFRKEHPVDYYAELSDQAKDNELRSLDFWRAVNADPIFLQKVLGKLNGTKAIGPRILTKARSRYIDMESVDHFIPVYWHQREPFNLYCPLISQDSSARCPAGCAPLAIAQAAYYLHYFIDGPDFTPSSGYCYGWVGNYSQSFSNLSTSPWDSMAYSNDPYGYAALLIGFLGKAMNVVYDSTVTTTSFTRMANVLGSHLGLHYLTGAINYDIVYSNLHSRIPVICAAYKITEQGRDLHSFILDGYESLTFETNFEYSDQSGTNRESLTLLEPIMTHVRINWGAGSTWRDETYPITGSWRGYDSCRTMIYDIMTENK